MKNIYKCCLFSTIAIVGAISLFSCNYEKEDFTTTGDAQLDGFFRSSAYDEFSKSYQLKLANFQVNNAQIIAVNPEKNVTTYSIPITKKHRIVGHLIVFSKQKGLKYQTIYENIENFDPQIGGQINIEINRKFVARYEGVPSKGTLISVKLVEVADVSSFFTTKVPLPEWPSGNEGWWECTTMCYAYAKAACGSDAACDLLLDLVNLSGAGTISISVACGFYCI